MLTSRTPLPPWRSLLFVPADRQRFIEKATTRGADAIILDLEDGVDATGKPDARRRLAESVAVVGTGGAGVLVRINSTLRQAAADLEAAVIPGVHALVVPKVESLGQLNWLSEAVAELEAERGLTAASIGLVAQIESPGGFPVLDELGREPRLWALAFGPEDFCAGSGIKPSPATLSGPCQQLVLACARQGLVPLGFPDSIGNYSDLVHFRQVIERASAMGFQGATVIHPDQVAVTNDGFSPSAEALARAKQLLSAWEEHSERGEAVFAFEGEMVDRPVAERARQLLIQSYGPGAEAQHEP